MLLEEVRHEFNRVMRGRTVEVIVRAFMSDRHRSPTCSQWLRGGESPIATRSVPTTVPTVTAVRAPRRQAPRRYPDSWG